MNFARHTKKKLKACHSRVLRVCILVARFPPDIGGTQNQAYRLARSLKQNGLDVEILIQKYESSQELFNMYDGLPVWRLGRAIGKNLSSLSYIVTALVHIWKTKPDITHAHMLSSPAIIAVISKMLWGIPCIAKVSGLGKVGEIGVAKRHFLRNAKIKFLKKHLDIVIATSKQMHNELKNAGFSELKLQVIPNGVDGNSFVPVDNKTKKKLREQLGLPDGLIVIYTGRFSYEKGVDVLLDAWGAHKLNERATLILVGKGEESKNIECKHLKNVIFTGPTMEVVKYLQASDIFVLPSREEAMPNSLLEAMSCGLACVATKVGGIPEIITNDIDGLLAATCSAGSIGESLSKLIDDAEYRSKLGIKARQKVLELYSLDYIAAKYMKIYEKLMSVHKQIRFKFGANWKRYLKFHLDAKANEEAKKSLTDFLNLQSLQGKTFTDVGCGSGIFSYAAYELGASKIISFDVDEDSVDCCKHMKSVAGSPAQWHVYRGSILDDKFNSELDKADIVYSWGVLHHTGDMWTAVRKAVALVQSGGLFFISIYNKVEYNKLKNYRGSYLWLKIKKTYNLAGPLTKKLLEWSYMFLFVLKKLAKGQNPIYEVKTYKSNRGMSWHVDVTDWLGGYPYEFATVQEITDFCTKELKLQFINFKPAKGLGCNQYLFRKPSF